MVKTDGRANQTGPAPVIFQMATAYLASQAIYVAAELGIADVLGDGSKSGDEIASAIGSNSKSLARLTRALIALGVLAVTDDGRFQLTGIGALLQSGMPGSMPSIILTLGEEHYASIVINRSRS